jgi:pimeloyl-ACP methyl ester carboxylesterase
MTKVETEALYTRETLQETSGLLVPVLDASRGYVQEVTEGSLMHTDSLPGTTNTETEYMRFGAADEFDPRDLGDKQVVNVWLTPFAQRIGQATAMRALSVKAGVEQATGQKEPLVVLAQNTTGPAIKVYSQAELKQIAEGDLTPEVTRLVQMIDAVSPNAQVRLLGHSLGAQIATFAAGDERLNGRVLGVMASEPPNVVDRTPKQLEADFRGKLFGIPNLVGLYRAQADGGSKTFRQISGTTPLTGHRLALELGGFAKSARLPENRAFHNAMANDGFADLVDQAFGANPDMRISVIRGLRSAITPVDPVAGDAFVEVSHISGYGHEIHDNLALLAHLARNSATQRSIK